MSAIDCQVPGKIKENPTKDGNEKRSIERRALEREPSDLAITIKAGMKRSVRTKRTINISIPRSNQV
jgi:hypothetical protein